MLRGCMPFVPNQRRRWFGLFYLISSAGLLIWGLTLLRPVLRGWLFIGYWLACLLCALLALVTAWLDMRAIRRYARAEKRELLEQALTRIARESPTRQAGTGQTGAEPREPPSNHA